MGTFVLQGWHSDPFGLHEQRYFSADGQPTKLVRDRGAESYDEPPSGADEVAAAMARISAAPEPPGGYAPRDAYPPGPASRGGSRSRPVVTVMSVTGIILGAVGIAFALVPHSRSQTPELAGKPGVSDVAFVTQAAARTLKQRTTDIVLSASLTTDGKVIPVNATGAFGPGGKAWTMVMTAASQSGRVEFRYIDLDGHLYTGMSLNGRSVLPKGKSWITEPVTSQNSGTTLPGGTNPTAALASLQSQGATVRALGNSVIGGVGCTGYSVTEPGTQATVTVWINQQNLVREISADSASGAASTSTEQGAAIDGSSGTGAVDQLKIDFSYSAAALRLTAPSAASTITFAAYLQQMLGQNSAVTQLEKGIGS